MPTFATALPITGLLALIGYLLGSIPSGVLVTRALGLGDLRRIGSGNIGATNVLRTGSRPAAALTLLADMAKGALAVLAARHWGGPDAAQAAALAAVLGHLYPIWLRFRGGKGMATLLGVVTALNPVLGLLAALAWLFTAFVFRISSLAALAAAGLTPLFALFLGSGNMFLVLVVLVALVYWRHAANIRRLREGTEPKIGAKST